MFRLFLRRKLLAGVEPKKDAAAKAAGEGKRVAPKENRRVYARYNVDHKHLTLMNAQDILLVREISSKGFSTEVSKRGFDRLAVGDRYEARMRYLGEIYDLQARVAWKHKSYVGFEIVKAGRETMLFIQRLLRPIEIAMSMQAVEPKFMTDGNAGKTWFHGDSESDLYVWNDVETGELKAWQLTVGDSFVEWDDAAGISTGALRAATSSDVLGGSSAIAFTRDNDVDRQKRQLAIDVIMALQYPVRDQLLETLTAGS